MLPIPAGATDIRNRHQPLTLKPSILIAFAAVTSTTPFTTQASPESTGPGRHTGDLSNLAEVVKVQISLAAARFCLGYSEEAQKFLCLASSRGQTEHVVVLGLLEL